MKYSLTPKQQEAYDFISMQIKERGMAPNMAELAKAMGSVKSGAHRYFASLVERGYLVQMKKGAHRAYALADDNNSEYIKLKRCYQAADVYVRKKITLEKARDEGAATDGMVMDMQRAFNDLKTRTGEAA